MAQAEEVTLCADNLMLHDNDIVVVSGSNTPASRDCLNVLLSSAALVFTVVSLCELNNN